MDNKNVRKNKRAYCEESFTLICESKRLKEDIKNNSMNPKYIMERPLSNVYVTNNDNSLLPINYTNLLNVFVSLELVVNKLINGHEVLYINRIQNVLKQMNKSFNVNVFGQILSVFPESYQYEFEKTPLKITRHHNKLQILPNLNFGISSDSSPRKTTKSLSLSQLLVRKNTFRERLLMLVKEKHDEFLLNVKKMKIEDIKKMKIIRWNCDFDVNSVDAIVARNLDRNSSFSVESPLMKTFPNTMTIDIDKSNICKDLFGTSSIRRSSLKEDNFDDKNTKLQIKKEIGKENVVTIEVKKIKKRSKGMNQSQLSFGFNDSKDTLQKQVLPFHLKSLLDLFVCIDKSVQSLFTKGDIVYLSRILKMASSAKTITEYHFGQLLTIYPDAYKLRWEKMLNKQTNKLSSKLDIVVIPQLRNDGTEVAMASPDKGFLKFDCVRLTQRQQRFLGLCRAIVGQCRDQFMAKHGPGTVFNADLHVAMVDSSPLPARPVVKYGDKDMAIRSVAEMFSIIKERHVDEMKDVEVKLETVSEKLRKIPHSLLEKVRRNKEERLLFGRKDGDGRRRLILERLPEMVAVMLLESRKDGGCQGVLEKRWVLEAVRGGGDRDMTEGDFDDHLAVLDQVVPGLVRSLDDWTTPSLRIGPTTESLADIRLKIASALNAQS